MGCDNGNDDDNNIKYAVNDGNVDVNDDDSDADDMLVININKISI